MDKFRIYKNLIPLLMLAGICVYTVFVTFSEKVLYEDTYYDRTFSIPHYIGLAGVTLSVLTYFFKRKLFKAVLLLTLGLGLFNLANFTPDTLSVGIGPIGIQPLSLLLIIIYYFLNKQSAHRFLNDHIIPSPSPQKQAKNWQEKVAKFRETFAKKSDESLRDMVQKRAVVPAALEAAKQLLQDRGIEVPNR